MNTVITVISALFLGLGAAGNWYPHCRKARRRRAARIRRAADNHGLPQGARAWARVCMSEALPSLIAEAIRLVTPPGEAPGRRERVLAKRIVGNTTVACSPAGRWRAVRWLPFLRVRLLRRRMRRQLLLQTTKVLRDLTWAAARPAAGTPAPGTASTPTASRC